MKCLKINKSRLAVICALLSAVLYAVCIPCAKILTQYLPPAIMGGLLYLGAGIGLSISTLIKKGKAELSLTKNEFPYICAMILLDITAVILLMFGITKTISANASLLGNFELVATSIFAFLIFKETISKKLLTAIILITTASIILSFEGLDCFKFNIGSIFVILSCICWGLENNCTRKISSKDTRQITTIKGLFCGLGGLITAYFAGETILNPEIKVKFIILTLILGFLSYGISVSLYIYAQRFLGAVKTGALYSLAPFFGVLFSLFFLKESPSTQFYIALLIMILGSFLVVKDN